MITMMIGRQGMEAIRDEQLAHTPRWPETRTSPCVVVSQCDWPDMDAFRRMRAQAAAEVINRHFLEDMKKFIEKDPTIWFMEIKVNGA
ncbi:hypothetical protein F4809DRAFT_641741 [Biscogniauxia mediterranea]|nr:hypothetical protein F4809DRAFT_641741 [Biscogniauxia mediterranea]